MHLVLLPTIGLHVFTIRFNGYRILEVKKKKNPTNRPIQEIQGRERENKNIFKVGLTQLICRLTCTFADYIDNINTF